jgi:hypothetical protein
MYSSVISSLSINLMNSPQPTTSPATYSSISLSFEASRLVSSSCSSNDSIQNSLLSDNPTTTTITPLPPPPPRRKRKTVLPDNGAINSSSNKGIERREKYGCHRDKETRLSSNQTHNTIVHMLCLYSRVTLSSCT